MPKSIPTLPENVPAYREEPVSENTLRQADDLIRDSGILPRLNEWRSEDRLGSASRPLAISDRAVLTAWQVAAIEGRPLRAATLSAILFERLPAQHRAAHGLGQVGDKQAATRRAVARLLEPLDPYPISRNKRHTYSEIRNILDRHNHETEAIRAQRLDEFTRRLLTSSTRRRLDQTFQAGVSEDFIAIPGPAMPPAAGAEPCDPSIDPFGPSDLFAGALPSDSRPSSNHPPLWGWRVRFLVPLVPVGSGARSPLVVVGMTLQRPGQSVAASLATLLQAAQEAGLRTNLQTSNTETWQALLTVNSSSVREKSDHRTYNWSRTALSDIPQPAGWATTARDARRVRETIHARAVRANVLGHLHRKSQGLAHAQVDLAIHLASSNILSVNQWTRKDEQPTPIRRRPSTWSAIRPIVTAHTGPIAETEVQK